MHDARYWIEQLKLTRHPEGGFYREIYRSSLTHRQAHLPSSFRGDRVASTSIFYLLEASDCSAFHRIASDELWHFYAGDPLEVYEIDAPGTLTVHILGNDPEQAQSFQAIVSAGNWFAAKPSVGSRYSLVGCTVSPGFDFADFEMAKPLDLSARYPQHKSLIESFTRKTFT